MTTVDVDEYAGSRVLAERGWTEAAIRRFLGEPDRRVPNPVYRTAAPARLYSMIRVTAAEATPEWQAWRLAAGKRSERGKAAAAVRRAQTITEVAALDIQVPVMDLDVLAERAVEHRNIRDADRAWDRGWDDPRPAEAGGVEQTTLNRWMVNYLRHRHTSYDADLSQLYGRVGRREAQAAIRRRVYDVIGGAYPSLAAECARQLAERDREDMLVRKAGRRRSA